MEVNNGPGAWGRARTMRCSAGLHTLSKLTGNPRVPWQSAGYFETGGGE